MSAFLHSSEDRKGTSNVFLYIAIISVNLISLGTGSAFSWSSPVIPKLKGLEGAANNPFEEPITSLEESWVSSLLSLGASLGPILGGLFVDRIGRKRTLLLFILPMIASHTIIMFAKTVQLYYVARILLGIGAGCNFLVAPMYIAEVSQPSNRGLLGCIMGVMLTLGTFSGYAIGPYTSITTFSIISVIPMITFLIVFGLFVPETPYYHILKNNRQLAEKSLNKFRGGGNNSKELEEIVRNVTESVCDKKSTCDLFKSRVVRRGLTISVGLMFFQQFTGITVILGNMQSIFDATGTEIPPEVSSIMIGAIHPLVCFLTSQLVDRVGRRFLLITSMIGVALSTSTLGIYLYLQSQGFDVECLYWLPITCLVVYTILYNLGIGPLAWAMMGELFPADVKALASVLSSFSCLFLAFITTLVYPNFVQNFGIAASFAVFAAVSTLGIFFMAFIAPETKGKSLEEIQCLLGGGKVGLSSSDNKS